MTHRNHHAPGARFFPLLTRAQGEEKTAAKTLGEAQRYASEQLHKLNELQNHAERTQSGELPLQPRALTNRHAFMGRLAEAIRQQRRQLAQAEQAVEHARKLWIEANHSVQRYQRLIETEYRRAQVHADRRDQKEQDEIALRRRRFVHTLAGG